jgi:hypothetical protein
MAVLLVEQMALMKEDMLVGYWAVMMVTMMELVLVDWMGELKAGRQVETLAEKMVVQLAEN